MKTKKPSVRDRSIKLMLNGDGRVKSVHAIQFRMYSEEEVTKVKRFLDKYAGENASGKVYSNKNCAIGMMAIDITTGYHKFTFVPTNSWIVVYEYKYGLNGEVFIVCDELKNKMFSELPSRKKKEKKK